MTSEPMTGFSMRQWLKTTVTAILGLLLPPVGWLLFSRIWGPALSGMVAGFAGHTRPGSTGLPWRRVMGAAAMLSLHGVMVLGLVALTIVLQFEFGRGVVMTLGTAWVFGFIVLSASLPVFLLTMRGVDAENPSGLSFQELQQLLRGIGLRRALRWVFVASLFWLVSAFMLTRGWVLALVTWGALSAFVPWWGGARLAALYVDARQGAELPMGGPTRTGVHWLWTFASLCIALESLSLGALLVPAPLEIVDEVIEMEETGGEIWGPAFEARPPGASLRARLQEHGIVVETEDGGGVGYVPTFAEHSSHVLYARETTHRAQRAFEFIVVATVEEGRTARRRIVVNEDGIRLNDEFSDRVRAHVSPVLASIWFGGWLGLALFFVTLTLLNQERTRAHPVGWTWAMRALPMVCLAVMWGAWITAYIA